MYFNRWLPWFKIFTINIFCIESDQSWPSIYVLKTICIHVCVSLSAHIRIQICFVSKLFFSWSIVDLLILVSGVQHSDSIFLKIILHIKLLLSIGYIPCAVHVNKLHPCSLFILYLVVCTSQSPTSILPIPIGNR